MTHLSHSHGATQHLPSAKDPTGPADASDSQWWYTQQEAKSSGIYAAGEIPDAQEMCSW